MRKERKGAMKVARRMGEDGDGVEEDDNEQTVASKKRMLITKCTRLIR